MSRAKLLWVSAICFAIVLAAGVVIYLCIPKEPRYQGRSLSTWLRQITPSGSPGDFGPTVSDPEFLHTQAAINEIGTNAIPVLIKWSYASDSKARVKITSWLNAHLPERFQIWDAQGRRFASEIGFNLLGEQARPAWPVFVQWTSDKDPERRGLGMKMLLTTKADKDITVPVLRRLIDDPCKPLREAAAFEFCFNYRKEAVAAGIYQKFPELHLQNLLNRDSPPEPILDF